MLLILTFCIFIEEMEPSVLVMLSVPASLEFFALSIQIIVEFNEFLRYIIVINVHMYVRTYINRECYVCTQILIQPKNRSPVHEE